MVMTFEKLMWAMAALGLIGIFLLSGNGFYRYPCQDPENWENAECNPPICQRTKNCAIDLTGDVE
jgi:hypothetical protein